MPARATTPADKLTAAPKPAPSRAALRPTRNTRTRKGSRKLVWDKGRTAVLFVRYQESRDPAIRDELVTMYMNLVGYLASKFRDRGEPVEDLVQVGTIGLIKAVDRFDPSRGLEFTTYATPTIVGEIKRHFRDKGWAIRVPRRIQELSAHVSRAVDVLTRTYQRSPTVTEIATHLGVDEADVLEAMDSAQAYSCAPLEAGGGHDGTEGFSILEHIGTDDPLMGVVDDRATLAAALKDLSSREQVVLYLRFFEGLTQTEIAKHLDISQMQVSRMLRKTLAVLRDNLVGDE
jgi:RNA polymerase sigma-B factor